MALLQISEPGMSTAPHQHRLAVGIDLGTTNSLVATVRSSIPEVLNDEEGHPLLPSVVRYLPNGHANIGYKAQAHQTTDPKNTIVSVKRFMGRGLKDIAYAENLPYDFVDGDRESGHGMVRLKTVAGVKSPVEVSAQILATLRQRAEDSLGDDLVGAVITVPAYFDEAQRQATKDAAQLAGINVLRLLSEPTAAGIAYGLDNGSEGIFAVYDLGGGTFDISILKLSKGVFEVLATGGDSALGGDDFDHRLFCWVHEQEKLAPLSDEDTATLMVKAREAKELLSTKPEVTIDAVLRSGEEVHQRVTPEIFADITKHLVAKTMNAVKKALRDANIDADDIDGVVMVGGVGIGPALEAMDVLAVLQGGPDAPQDLRQRALALAAGVLELGGRAAPGEGMALAAQALDSGAAWAKFQAICAAQGGLHQPPVAACTHVLETRHAGRVIAIDNRRLATLAKLAGAPRAAAAGVRFFAPLGSKLEVGQPILTIHADTPGELAYALEYAEAQSNLVTVEDA